MQNTNQQWHKKYIAGAILLGCVIAATTHAAPWDTQAPRRNRGALAKISRLITKHPETAIAVSAITGLGILGFIFSDKLNALYNNAESNLGNWRLVKGIQKVYGNTCAKLYGLQDAIAERSPFAASLCKSIIYHGVKIGTNVLAKATMPENIANEVGPTIGENVARSLVGNGSPETDQLKKEAREKVKSGVHFHDHYNAGYFDEFGNYKNSTLIKQNLKKLIPQFEALTEPIINNLVDQHDYSLLITGYAGVGKTQFVENVAKAMGLNFIEIDANCLKTVHYVGDESANFAALKEYIVQKEHQYKLQKQSIIFLDETDILIADKDESGRDNTAQSKTFMNLQNLLKAKKFHFFSASNQLKKDIKKTVNDRFSEIVEADIITSKEGVKGLCLNAITFYIEDDKTGNNGPIANNIKDEICTFISQYALGLRHRSLAAKICAAFHTQFLLKKNQAPTSFTDEHKLYLYRKILEEIGEACTTHKDAGTNLALMNKNRNDIYDALIDIFNKKINQQNKFLLRDEQKLLNECLESVAQQKQQKTTDLSRQNIDYSNHKNNVPQQNNDIPELNKILQNDYKKKLSLLTKNITETMSNWKNLNKKHNDLIDLRTVQFYRKRLARRMLQRMVTRSHNRHLQITHPIQDSQAQQPVELVAQPVVQPPRSVCAIL